MMRKRIAYQNKKGHWIFGWGPRPEEGKARKRRYAETVSEATELDLEDNE